MKFSRKHQVRISCRISIPLQTIYHASAALDKAIGEVENQSKKYYTRPIYVHSRDIEKHVADTAQLSSTVLDTVHMLDVVDIEIQLMCSRHYTL